MNHCTMEQLLAVRNGEETASCRAHIDACEVCRRELDLVYQRAAGLRALPALRAPRDRWGIVRAQMQLERRRRLWRWTRRGAVAVAASLALVFGGRSLLEQQQEVARADDLSALLDASGRLEDALRRFDPTSRVLSSTSAAAVADIEDRIAVIDAQLAELNTGNAGQQELVELWRERVGLMDALVGVHLSRAAYVGL